LSPDIDRYLLLTPETANDSVGSILRGDLDAFVLRRCQRRAPSRSNVLGAGAGS
jgi:hypothetical protein